MKMVEFVLVVILGFLACLLTIHAEAWLARHLDEQSRIGRFLDRTNPYMHRQ